MRPDRFTTFPHDHVFHVIVIPFSLLSLMSILMYIHTFTSELHWYHLKSEFNLRCLS